MKTLLEVFESLDPTTIIRNVEFGDEHTVKSVLIQLSADPAMAEPAVRQGNEIYLNTDADPVFIIV
jgi:hypothetical protein